VQWRVWAPRANAVRLVLLDGGQRRSVLMKRRERAFFEHVEPEIEEGQRYAFRLNDGPERPDPASLWQPEGVHQPSAVVRLERFVWTDQHWQGVPRNELILYELHVGSFTPEGTFAAIIPRLATLRELGITAIELMPVAQFPGQRNWGYDGVFPYAAQNSYGGPLGLQRLVDACHAAGMAIFLDVVYNHLGPEGNYLNEFGPYFTNRYQTAWGTAINYDGAGSDAVRDFVLDNVRMWLDEFHVDGLRLDAVHAMYDFSPHHILRAIQEVAEEVGKETGRRLHVIAESDLNDPKLLQPPDRGGYGLDAQWSDDFHHAVHAFLTGEQQGYYVDFGRAEDIAEVLRQPFLYAGRYSAFRDRKHGALVGDLSGDRFVVSIQNHDQVGNRAQGDRLAALLCPPAQRLAACFLLLSPHVPLLFMGEEYGEGRPFPFFCSFEDAQLVENVRAGRRAEFAAFAWQGEVPDPQGETTFAASRLSWSWPNGTKAAGLRRLYADLLTARRAWPPLRDFVHRQARLLPEQGRPVVLHLTRGTGDDGVIQVFFNLTNHPQSIDMPPESALVILFASESVRYAGNRVAPAGTNPLGPFECLVLGSPVLRSFGSAG
jgi:maltooligosyltrehalose trehalohydrolase